MREINLLFFELYQAYHLYRERMKEIWEEWLLLCKLGSL